MAIKAGQAGSFELADMAKYLPEQLANAGNAGMKGLDDFATLLGLNQLLQSLQAAAAKLVIMLHSSLLR